MAPFQARWRQRAADTSRDTSVTAIHSEGYKECEPLSEYSGVGMKAEMKEVAQAKSRASAFYTSWTLYTMRKRAALFN